MILKEEEKKQENEKSFIFIKGRKYKVKENTEITNLINKDNIRGRYFVKRIERI